MICLLTHVFNFVARMQFIQHIRQTTPEFFRSYLMFIKRTIENTVPTDTDPVGCHGTNSSDNLEKKSQTPRTRRRWILKAKQLFGGTVGHPCAFHFQWFFIMPQNIFYNLLMDCFVPLSMPRISELYHYALNESCLLYVSILYIFASFMFSGNLS
mmetsp:Transcript_4754/g.7043  ORF Transcript_4754/g.7043 Transcript_4754/m.7043 type:complete len:155 (+) Transcript_4754:536-1000(+)